MLDIRHRARARSRRFARKKFESDIHFLELHLANPPPSPASFTPHSIRRESGARGGFLADNNKHRRIDPISKVAREGEIGAVLPGPRV